MMQDKIIFQGHLDTKTNLYYINVIDLLKSTINFQKPFNTAVDVPIDVPKVNLTTKKTKITSKLIK